MAPPLAFFVADPSWGPPSSQQMPVSPTLSVLRVAPRNGNTAPRALADGPELDVQLKPNQSGLDLAGETLAQSLLVASSIDRPWPKLLHRQEREKAGLQRKGIEQG